MDWAVWCPVWGYQPRRNTKLRKHIMVDVEITIRLTDIEDTPEGVSEYLDHYLKMSGKESIISFSVIEKD
jgi:hypothetical protein